MAARFIKDRILKHLSERSDTWSSTVSKVSVEVGSQFFTEQAMKELVEDGEVTRDEATVSNLPKYQAPGAGEGKYGGFNNKRFSPEPWKKPLGYDEGA